LDALEPDLLNEGDGNVFMTFQDQTGPPPAVVDNLSDPNRLFVNFDQERGEAESFVGNRSGADLNSCALGLSVEACD
jgi:hypothetical protein